MQSAVDGRSEERARRDLAIRLPYLLLLLMLALWLWLFASTGAVQRGPTGQGLASDFAMFWTASRVLAIGQNPYSPAHLYAAERRLLAREGIRVLDNRPLVRVGNPPLFFWAMRPLAALPFRVAAVAWTIAMAFLSAVSLLALLRRARLPRPGLALIVAVAMPATTLAVFYGGPNPLILAALSGALLVARRFPVAAGAITAVGLLKPELGVPLATLIAVFSSSSFRRFAAGAAAGAAALALLSLLAVGPEAMSWWLSALFGYTRDIGQQPNVASLVGLYARWAPLTWRIPLEVLQGFAALAATILARICRPHHTLPLASVAWLWFVWFLAAPYAHFPDLLLLAPAVIALLRPSRARGPNGRSLGMLYVLAGSVALYSAVIAGIQLLCLPVIAAGACAGLASIRQDAPSPGCASAPG